MDMELPMLTWEILGNRAPSGPDGSTASSSSVTLVCCEVDLDLWDPLGPLTLVNEGCSVATEATSWGYLKAMFR